MIRLYLFIVVIIFYSCNEGYKAPSKPVLKTDIIGEWKIGDVYAVVDTTIASELPDIDLEADLSFYNNGRFKKKDMIAGYTSDYKIKGDTLFVYEPIKKYWCAVHVEMHTKDRMEISNRRGLTRADTHYMFNRVINRHLTN